MPVVVNEKPDEKPKVDEKPKGPKAATTPKPKAVAPTKPARGEPGYRTPQERRLQDTVTAAYQVIGMGVAGLGMQLQDEGLVGVGSKTVDMAERTADAWIVLAQQNSKVMDLLVRLTEASKVGTLIGCHVAIILPLLVSRGMVPEGAAQFMESATQ